MVALSKRVESLELWKTTQEIENARASERKSNTDERFNRIEKRLDKIDGHVSRLVWLVVTAIGSAFMAFLIQGGFSGHI